MNRLLGVVVAGMMAAGVVRGESSVLDFEAKSIDGKPVKLEDYRGKVVLIVNVASKCGLTPQYEGLQALHEEYGEEGLAILAFPCNQFGRQEPGTAAEIKEFCSSNYGVEFDLFTKIEVNGSDQHPLYAFLTGEETNPESSGPIKWNFTKFLISRDGELVERFEPRTTPDSKKLVNAIKSELAEG